MNDSTVLNRRGYVTKPSDGHFSERRLAEREEDIRNLKDITEV